MDDYQIFEEWKALLAEFAFVYDVYHNALIRQQTDDEIGEEFDDVLDYRRNEDLIVAGEDYMLDLLQAIKDLEEDHFDGDTPCLFPEDFDEEYNCGCDVCRCSR